jgi:tripartite-type tricarboxylate transporter receptor subunit TctC
MAAATAAEPPYPSRPIRLIVASAPGGPNDIVARMVATPWGDALGKPIVVDNRAGATGMIGTEMGARAAPDGYTLLVGFPGPLIIAPLMSEKAPYDALKDFAPISLAVSAPFVLIVSPSLPRSRRRSPGRSTMHRAARARAATWPWSSSSSWRAWTSCTCPTRGPVPA